MMVMCVGIGLEVPARCCPSTAVLVPSLSALYTRKRKPYVMADAVEGLSKIVILQALNLTETPATELPLAKPLVLFPRFVLSLYIVAYQASSPSREQKVPQQVIRNLEVAAKGVIVTCAVLLATTKVADVVDLNVVSTAVLTCNTVSGTVILVNAIYISPKRDDPYAYA